MKIKGLFLCKKNQIPLINDIIIKILNHFLPLISSSREIYAKNNPEGTDKIKINNSIIIVLIYSHYSYFYDILSISSATSKSLSPKLFIS